MLSIFLDNNFRKGLVRLFLGTLFVFSFGHGVVAQGGDEEPEKGKALVVQDSNSLNIPKLSSEETSEFLDNLISRYGDNLKKWPRNICDQDSLIVAHYFNDDMITNKYKLTLVPNRNSLTFETERTGGTITSMYTEQAEYIEMLTTVENFAFNKVPKGSLKAKVLTIEVDSSVFTRHRYNNKLRVNQHPVRFTFGVSGSINLAYRSLSYNYFNSNVDDEMAFREENELVLPSGAFNVNVGVANYSHHFSLNYSRTRYGFKFNNQGVVNLKSGLYSPDSTLTEQVSNTNSFGIQYEYVKYYRKWSPYFQLGLHFAFDQKGDQGLGNHRNNYFGTMLKSGIGINYKPCYSFEFHLSPVGMIFLNSKQATRINSRYYAIGLELGCRVNICKLDKVK